MSAGTLTLTNNSDAVTGAGTTFTTELAAGDFIVTTVGGITYTLPVKSIGSGTQLVLVTKYPGPTHAGAAWQAVPRAAQNQITAELVAQTTAALRGLNYDKQNWQAVFSASGDITVVLPDGSTFTGPSWQSIKDTLSLIDIDAVTQLANQVRTDAQQVATDKPIIIQAKTDAETAKTASETAQGKAETAQQKSEAAQGKSETAQAAAELAATNAAGTLSYILGNFQPLDPTLTALAALVGVANKLPYFNGDDTAALTDLTQVGRDIIGKSTIADILTYLGLGDTSGYVGRWVNTRVFTSSGTYTPTPGTKRIRVTITGGGGGGGGCQAMSSNETFFGAGAGAGGTVITILTPTQNSYPVTIGAGGAGGVSATNGTSGGNSVFASLIAPGGAGGGKVGVTNTNGGNGGVPSTGDIRITGGNGGDGQSGNISVSGEGGTSYWGGGGRAGAGGGVSGKAYGSGGGGAYDAGYSGTSMTGGKGADGVCIIEEFA